MKKLSIVAALALSAAHSSNIFAQLIPLESKAKFEAYMAEGKPLVLDFFATWCGVCKRSEPMVNTLAKQTDIHFIKIDGDRFPDLKEQYRVNGFPSFVFLDASGKEAHRVVGMDEQSMKIGLSKIRKSVEKPMTTEKPMIMEKKEPKAMPAAMPMEQKEEMKKELKTMPAQSHAMDSNLVELESMAHLQELKSKGMPIMFDVYTTWCGPCKMMKPIIEALSKEYTDVIFVTINAEKAGLESINRTYGVEAYPTFIFMDKTGKEVERHRGSGDAMLLKSMLGKISNKKTSVVVMSEKDMMAKMQAEQKMMAQPKAAPMQEKVEVKTIPAGSQKVKKERKTRTKRSSCRSGSCK